MLPYKRFRGAGGLKHVFGRFRGGGGLEHIRFKGFGAIVLLVVTQIVLSVLEASSQLARSD